MESFNLVMFLSLSQKITSTKMKTDLTMMVMMMMVMMVMMMMVMIVMMVMMLMESGKKINTFVNH